jgi:hypothetical protein
VELPPWRRLERGSKDDDAVGSRGQHPQHGLCGARPLGVHLPGIANEVARGMRSGEIGPFVVG